MRRFPATILSVFVLLSVSCGRGDRLPDDLSLAESYINSQPDSALVLLDSSASYAESSNRYLRASYCLLRTYAEYNSYKPGIDEPRMNEGVDYFLKYGNKDRKALAYYLRAVVRADNKSGDEAEWANDLLLATKEIERSDNHLLSALINLRYAVVLDSRKWYDASLPYLEKGLEEAGKAGSLPLQVTALINLSHRALFLGDENKDFSEAIEYAVRAAEISKGADNDYARALYNLAACYSRDGQFDKSLECATTAVRTQERLFREGKRKARVRYAVLADAFRKMNMPDSALFYAAKEMATPDLSAKLSGTQLTYIVYRDLLGDTDNAVKYLTKYNELKHQQEAAQQNDRIIEDRVEVEKADIRSSRSRIIGTSVAVVLSLFIAIYFIVRVFRRHLRNRDEALERKDSEIGKGQALLHESESERSELRSVLMFKDKLVMSLRQNARYLSDEEWLRLEKILDDVCNKFTQRLKTSFPGLTGAELRIAVLLRFGFSGKEMAAMMGISPTSVTKGKQRLKSRVASALPEGVNIDEFIATF